MGDWACFATVVAFFVGVIILRYLDIWYALIQERREMRAMSHDKNDEQEQEDET